MDYGEWGFSLHRCKLHAMLQTRLQFIFVVVRIFMVDPKSHLTIVLNATELRKLRHFVLFNSLYYPLSTQCHCGASCCTQYLGGKKKAQVSRRLKIINVYSSNVLIYFRKKQESESGSDSDSDRNSEDESQDARSVLIRYN